MMNENFFESFAFKKRDITEEIPVYKKQKIIEYDINSFVSPNIFVFHIEKQKNGKFIFDWLLTDSVGVMLYQYEESLALKKDCIDENFLKVFQHAAKSGCTILTYNKDSVCNQIQQFLSIPFNTEFIFCMKQCSSTRCGVIRLDGKRRISSHKEMYFDMCKGNESFSQNCYYILHSFIAGRLRGWW